MKSVLLASFASVFLLATTANAQEQDVCKAQVSKVKGMIESDYAQWIEGIKDLPPEIQDSYKKIFDYNRGQSFAEADRKGSECDKQYIVPQLIVDAVVLYYTGGLSKILPEKMTHVDVSQLMSGHPLGGPNAAIPKFREQVLSSIGMGGNSTPANIIRDPWKCMTFQRKC